MQKIVKGNTDTFNTAGLLKFNYIKISVGAFSDVLPK